ncbi:MAG: hypothetical protein AB4040_11680 [Synechococcus sp.]
MRHDKARHIEVIDGRKSSIKKINLLIVVRMVFGLLVGGYFLVSLRADDSKYQSMQKCTIRSEQEYNLGVWKASNAVNLGEKAAWSDALDAWNRAIQHMRKVERCSRYYSLAERKISEYEASLDEINSRINN